MRRIQNRTKGSKLPNYFAGSFDALGQFLHRSSAMGPVLGMCLLISIVAAISICAALKIEKFVWLAYICVGILALVFVAAIGVYVYFSLTNPRVLQSEECQITLRQMDMAVAARGLQTTISDNNSNSGQIILDVSGKSCGEQKNTMGVENALEGSAS